MASCVRGSGGPTTLVADGNLYVGVRSQQGGFPKVTRAFCMPEQWVRAGARVSVRFPVPLAAKAPVFTVDWNADGKPDSVGPFRPGGKRFPTSDRC